MKSDVSEIRYEIRRVCPDIMPDAMNFAYQISSHLLWPSLVLPVALVPANWFVVVLMVMYMAVQMRVVNDMHVTQGPL